MFFSISTRFMTCVERLKRVIDNGRPNKSWTRPLVARLGVLDIGSTEVKKLNSVIIEVIIFKLSERVTKVLIDTSSLLKITD